MHGDKDGFVVLDRSGIEELIQPAQKTKDEERSYIKFLNSSEFNVAELKRRLYDA